METLKPEILLTTVWTFYVCHLLFQLRYVGRAVHPTPATGVGEIHQSESKEIIEAVFA